MKTIFFFVLFCGPQPISIVLIIFLYFQVKNKGKLSVAVKQGMNFLLTESQPQTPSPVKILTQPLFPLQPPPQPPATVPQLFSQQPQVLAHLPQPQQQMAVNTLTNRDLICELNVISAATTSKSAANIVAKKSACLSSCPTANAMLPPPQKEQFLDFLSEFENFEPIYDDIEFSYDDPFQIL